MAPASAEPITVEGNHRVDTDTIRSYFTSGTAEGVKSLKDTGLFSSVRTRQGPSGLIVTVTENSVINRVAFEGNSKIKSEQLAVEVSSKSRGAFDPAVAQADIGRIQEIYRRAGRADATASYRTVDLPNGKLDLVFTVDEGSKTGVKSIEFTGNQAFSARKLRGLMQTTEMNLISFFKTSDVYDPDKIATDEELIRRFYLRNGYADFRIVNTDVKFNAEEKGYDISIAVEEGQQYKVAAVSVDSRLRGVTSEQLTPFLRTEAGDVYNGDDVEKTVDVLTRETGRLGYAFAQVRPRGDRNAAAHSVSIQYVVDEGPRVYIERINVRGNTRTRDYVIRREFDIGEGDPYNKVLIDRAERRLNGLGFFKKVRITNEPGSSADRVIIDVDVEDQPTGSFSISGGYSTTDGFIAEVAVTETNFLGRGDYVRVAAQEGQNARGIDLSFTEPYLFDTRIAGGIDLFAKENDNTQYAEYSTFVTGGTVRFGIPVTDEFSVSPHYSIYNTKISIPNKSGSPYNDCTYPINGTTPGYGALAGTLSVNNNCLTNGEASLAIKQSVGDTLTSLAGVNLNYNTLDNLSNPSRGLTVELRNDVAGLGGDSQFFRTAGDLRYFHPIYDDIVGIVHVQGGNITGFGSEKQIRIADEFQLGPQLVRGFAPGGIGPRDISDPANYKYNPLGGSHYYGASLEAQFPLYGLPRDLGLKGAVFADAGSLFGYNGKTNFTANGGACVPSNTSPLYTQGTCVTVRDSDAIRSSVGASIIWNSPLGPLRFDYAYALSKDKYDVTQAFRFSGGTKF
ncbi:outer membrane protein assembly factor BamA [Lichenifustis flavocetrariae]|uniref:Outer membrane protein assembly factor BamA n=1 Tax=Lichenifustis flavocetrariae TaxID=2949735 RepID=A0AA41Z030_9HYPH|nr:outer membrane protein assembly factor BamA [Lichenifustis flavocetrariae]MCW6510395.1 outer membrane protein assembly factor BamA [Lichenifustis flavocetrariae]